MDKPAKIFLCLAIMLSVVLVLPLTAFRRGMESPPDQMYHQGWIDFNKNGLLDIYEDPGQTVELRISDLIGQMSMEEKTCQLATLYGYGRVCKEELPSPGWKNEIWKDGIGNIDEHLNNVAYNPNAATDKAWPPSLHVESLNEVQRFFVEETRLGIPVDFTNEGIRGLCHEKATSFPSQVGIGASWNRKLVRHIGRIEGQEARLLGYTNVYAPILDLARDPRWGRVVECYGEDPFLVGELGFEMVRALQDRQIVSTPKHFAVYSAPKGGRDGEARTDPHVSEREMYSMYLYPFRRAIRDAGAMGVMSSYNDYNGIPVTGSDYFLSDVLRDQWGFKGYVVSDSRAVEYISEKHGVAADLKEAVFQAITAGLNVRTDFTMPQDYISPLRELVKEGRVSETLLNSRVSDVLRVKFWLGLFDNPYNLHGEEADQIVGSPESEKIAYQASLESIVLLKNEEGLLPLDFSKYKTILVTGPNAAAVNHSISRYGPSNIEVTSILNGIRNTFPDNIKLRYTKGCAFFDENWPENELYSIPPTADELEEMQKAVKLARKSDLVIVVVGDDESTVGEARSRTSLDLPGNQQELVEALHRTGKPVVVVLVNGRALTVNWIDAHIPAILEAWFQGKHGGSALADVLTGRYNPGGKLPVSFPKSVGQIPMNFPTKPGAQADQAVGMGPDALRTRNGGFLYPFGFGLSYTSFSYDEFSIETEGLALDELARVTVEVSNTGVIRGDEIVQLYFSDPVSSVTVYERQLRGFERVSLEPGETRQVVFTLDQEDLALLNKDMEWVLEPGEFRLMVGTSSEDIRLKGSFYLNMGCNLSEER